MAGFQVPVRRSARLLVLLVISLGLSLPRLAEADGNDTYRTLVDNAVPRSAADEAAAGDDIEPRAEPWMERGRLVRTLAKPAPREAPGVLMSKGATGGTQLMPMANAALTWSYRHVGLFTPGGLLFTPKDGAGTAMPGASLAYRLQAMWRGTQLHYWRLIDGLGTLTVEDHAVVYERKAGFREVYRVYDRGIEQLFELDTIPAGSGDLIVRGRCLSNLSASSQPDGGIDFSDASGPVVRFGRAIAYDATGSVVSAPLVLNGDQLEIHVPGSWLQTAQAPIVIDPLIESNVQLTDLEEDEECVDIAFNAADGEYAICYITEERKVLAASRIDDEGEVVEGGIELDESNVKAHPAIAWSEASVNRYLIAYTSDDDVWVVIVDEELSIESGPTRIHDPTGTEEQYHPDVAYDPSRNQWVVVWAQKTGSSTSHDIYAEFVDTGGSQGGAILVEDHATLSLGDPAVALSQEADEYLISFNAGSDLWGELIDAEGLETQDNLTIRSASETQSTSAIAWNVVEDHWLVVFESTESDEFQIRAERLNAAGDQLTSLAVADGTAEKHEPAVAWLQAENSYLMAWQEQDSESIDIKGREMDAGGSLVGSTLALSEPDGTDEVNPAIAVNQPDGEWVTAWDDGRSETDIDIWGQRLDAGATDSTAPAAPSITSPTHNSEVEDSTPTVSGTAEALSTVEVLVGGSPTTPATTTTATATGTFSVDLAESLSNGSHTLTATATDASNNTSSASSAVTITVVAYTVSFSGPAFLLQPDGGDTIVTTVSVSDPNVTITVKTTNATHFKLLSGMTEVEEITGVKDNDTITLTGLAQGPGPSGSALLRAETPGGIMKAERDVVTKSMAFSIDAQCAVRNCPCTACGSLADKSDGAYINLGGGFFVWRVSVLPSVGGRNGLTPGWTLFHSSRAYSTGGHFGTSPFSLWVFQQVREEGSDIVWQDGQVREYLFDQSATGGTTAQARYEVLSETMQEVTIRTPGGTRFIFHPFDGSFKAGQLKQITNRFGDQIDIVHDDRGYATTVYGPRGRSWTLDYDSSGRLESITEDDSLLERTCSFQYDTENRLKRIDTTPVTTDGGIGNTFTSGKPFVIKYEATLENDIKLDTNIKSIVYPAEVLDSSDTARITLIYGEVANFEFDKVKEQEWGGTNASMIEAGGTLTYSYTDLAPSSPGPNDPVHETTATDRNGNITDYRMNLGGLAVEVEEETNRDIRGVGTDPASYLTERTYNSDQELLSVERPLGDKVELTYDTMNTDRYAHGNLTEVRQIADTARGGDGEGSSINDIVHTYFYEPIYQQVRIAISARGNDTGFTPPIADDEDNVQDLDFNLDDDTNDTNDGETLRARRYATLTIFDYQELTSTDILDLASDEGVTVTSTQADALSLGNTTTTDSESDGVTNQQVGRPIEVRMPTVTLEGGTAQAITRNYRWNAFAQLVKHITPEGYAHTYAYYAENKPHSTSGSTTPNPPGRTLSSTTGGYLKSQTMDDETLLRTPAVTTSRVDALTEYEYDVNGNLVELTDPRGIVHTYTVNERNQVQVSIRAEDASNLTSEEPRTLSSLHYETRTFYDANDNVSAIHVENVPAGTTTRLTGNPWLETDLTYDILDNLVEREQEISGGESVTIAGRSYSIGASESVTTKYRYDRNENLVATLSPVTQVTGSEKQEDNTTTSIYDERDLGWKSTRGGADSQFGNLTANDDISETIGSDSLTSTARTFVDDNGNPETRVDAEDNGDMDADGGDDTFMVYDGFNRTVAVFDAMDYERQTFYDPDSNVTGTKALGPDGGNTRGSSMNNVRLAESESKHDELSRVYRSEAHYFKNPGDSTVENYVTKTLFDRNSRVIKRTDPDGDETEFEHDGLDRTICTIDPEDNEVLRRYDDASNLIQSEETETSQGMASDETFYTDFFYDAAGRQDLVVDNLENAFRTFYDSRGNATEQTDANSTGTTTVDLARPTSTSTTINSAGNRTISVPDGLNRIIQVDSELRVGHDGASMNLDTSNAHNTDGLISVFYDYDPNSRLVKVTDDEDTDTPMGVPAQSETVYTYDKLNRLKETEFEDTTTWTRAFDKDDNVTSFTDQNGSVFTPTYDDLHRTVSLSISPATGVEGTTSQTWEFDGLSRHTRMTDNNGSSDDSDVNCTYDSLSRKWKETQKIGSLAARTVEREFDKDSNRIQLVYPSEIDGTGVRKVTYGFDALDRINHVEDGAGTGSGAGIVPDMSTTNDIATYVYIGPGRVESRSFPQPDIDLTLGYDDIRRITSMVHDDGTTDLIDLTYAYDKVGNRLYEQFKHESGDTGDLYGFDSANRAIFEAREAPSSAIAGVSNNQVANPSAPMTFLDTRDWTLDGPGNWPNVAVDDGMSTTNEARVANDVNEYDTVLGNTRLHDDNGNTTELDALQGDGNTETLELKHDALNRLVRVVRESDSTTLAEYAYDAASRRIRREVTNLSSLNAEVLYFYEGSRVIEEQDFSGDPVQQYVWGAAGELLQLRQDGTGGPEDYYVLENTLGSILATTDDAGTVLDEVDYRIYGEHVVAGASDPGVSEIALPYFYQGMRYDAESGFLLALGGLAMLDAGNGRFLSRINAMGTEYAAEQGNPLLQNSWFPRRNSQNPWRDLIPEPLEEEPIPGTPPQLCGQGGELIIYKPVGMGYRRIRPIYGSTVLGGPNDNSTPYSVGFWLAIFGNGVDCCSFTYLFEMILQRDNVRYQIEKYDFRHRRGHDPPLGRFTEPPRPGWPGGVSGYFGRTRAMDWLPKTHPDFGLILVGFEPEFWNLNPCLRDCVAYHEQIHVWQLNEDYSTARGDRDAAEVAAYCGEIECLDKKLSDCGLNPGPKPAQCEGRTSPIWYP